MHGPALKPGDRMGLIGGGQLGRMFVQAAMCMGFRVVVVDPSPDCPAAQVGAEPIVGRWDDPATLDRLAALVQVVTVEFENIPARSLFRLEKKGVLTRPGWRGLWVSQNRIREKRFLSRLGIPLPRWAEVRTTDDLPKVLEHVGLPLILKTASEGYDGKGQARVEHADSLAEAWATLGERPCVAESIVPFQAELSIIVGRDRFGEMAFHGPIWNHHTNHILDWSPFPAPFGPVVTTEARTIARKVVEAIDHVGLMTVELFLTSEGNWSSTNWLRGLITPGTGRSKARPPASSINRHGFWPDFRSAKHTARLRPAWRICWRNIWDNGEPDWSGGLHYDRVVKLHLYGKPSPRPARKMGHLSVIDEDPRQALARVLAVREKLARRSRTPCPPDSPPL